MTPARWPDRVRCLPVSIEQARRELSRWAIESHDCFLDFAEGLEADRHAVGIDPPRLLARLDAFAASLPFDELEEDDWVWLTTSTAAFLAEAVLHSGRARWDVIAAADRIERVLRVQGHDGKERTVAPFDHAYAELSCRPPVFTRALATMQTQAGLSPDIDDDDSARSPGAGTTTG